MMVGIVKMEGIKQINIKQHRVRYLELIVCRQQVFVFNPGSGMVSSSALFM